MKTIKINLKRMIEKMIIASSTGDEKSLEELKKSFKFVYYSVHKTVQSNILKYIECKTDIRNHTSLNKFFISFEN